MEFNNYSILKAVFESTNDGLLLVSNEGRVIQFNSRFHELWRIPLECCQKGDDEKLLNFILSQLLHPETFLSKVKELYQDHEAVSKDTIEFKDGRMFERYSRPLKSDSQTVGRIWSFRDITQYKRSQEVFAAITELSPDVISIIDLKGNLIFISSAFERIHGYSKLESLGKNIIGYVHPEDRERVAHSIRKIIGISNGQATIQFRCLNKDGSYCWMETKASNQVHNPLIQGVVAISREISDRKRLENELYDALHMRDEFMSLASHELKTPITSIKLQLQMLKRMKSRLTPRTETSTKAEDLDNLIDQVSSLQRLIDDLLNVSRINTGKLSLEPRKENVSSLIHSTIIRFTELFKEANCTLEINIENNIFIFCDRIRIEQVLVNLISNAVKYAPGTLLEINLHRTKEHAVFNIKDHGMGIPPEKYEAIFCLFERGNHKNYVTGLGIGLYISRSIIESHHGTIHVESRPGEGATFIVKIPLA